MASFAIQLRRMETSQPWGFRLRGGVDQDTPLFIEHVQTNGRAMHSGLKVGDRIVSICGVSTANMTHAEVKSEMLRAGNDLDLEIVRDAEVIHSASGEEYEMKRAEIDENPLQKFGGPTFKDVKPKTYKILETQLQGSAEKVEASSSRPSSIFDRKKEERSQYLKASGATIQKAYGQNC